MFSSLPQQFFLETQSVHQPSLKELHQWQCCKIHCTGSYVQYTATCRLAYIHINTSCTQCIYTHTHTLTLSCFTRFVFLFYLHSSKAKLEEFGRDWMRKPRPETEVISAVMRRSVKGQAFHSPGCVNNINTESNTPTLYPTTPPPKGLHSRSHT